MGSKRMAVVMLGDVMLGRLVDEALTVMENRAAIWGNTLPMLQNKMNGAVDDQIVAINLECAVTTHDVPAPKTFNFKMSPQNIDVLHQASVGFASLANNHILDFFEDGLIETMRVLSSAGIAFAGAGLTSEAAARPAIVEASDTRVAFLSYSDHYTEWRATSKRSGINYIDPKNYDRQNLSQQVRVASEQADLVIVFIHWGPNWAWQPSQAIQNLAHEFIDIGASAVFGHSAHHIQGIEIYHGKPIIYGAGGFIDDYALDQDYRNDLGFMYCLHLEDKQPTALELVPTRINHVWRKEVGARPPYFSNVDVATGDDRVWLFKNIKRLSGEYGTRIIEGQRSLSIALF